MTQSRRRKTLLKGTTIIPELVPHIPLKHHSIDNHKVYQREHGYERYVRTNDTNERTIRTNDTNERYERYDTNERYGYERLRIRTIRLYALAKQIRTNDTMTKESNNSSTQWNDDYITVVFRETDPVEATSSVAVRSDLVIHPYSEQNVVHSLVHARPALNYYRYNNIAVICGDVRSPPYGLHRDCDVVFKS